MDLQPAETTLYSLSDAPPSACAERREDDRLTTLYRVGSLSLGDQRELCLIKNISAGGMMIRAYCTLAAGTRVTVELKHGQPIAGTVSWVRDAHVGLVFDAPIDVIDILSNAAGSSRPRLPRIEVNRFVTVREGAMTYRMRTCDISQGGLKLRSEIRLGAGSAVVVTLAGMEPLPAVVRWSGDEQIGITFNRLLALPVLVAWLQEQPVPAASDT